MPEVLAEVTHHIDLSTNELIESILENQEGTLSANGAVRVETGDRTGRSPKDRFIVRDASTESTVDWGTVNQAIRPEVFTRLWQKAEAHFEQNEGYIAHCQVGADSKHGLPVKVMNEYAWHNLFARNLFIPYEGDFSTAENPWTLLSMPSIQLDPETDGTNSDGVVILNFTERKVLIIGMRYAGEMKKAMFSVLNFLLPEKNILPMHCAANMGSDNDVALFFGLSGTGKTTLSADPERFLIGDDEHGWSDDGIFNFEGGCYAKCIDLSPEREPVIYKAIKHGAIMENVVLDKQSQLPDYSDVSLTQNTRAAYPRSHIEKRVPENQGGQPSAVIFLCCDLYGVLPPVARLSKEQAAYYFLSGYTALVGSTEVGQTEAVKPTFSTCFGAPFFPRPAQVYADLLMHRIEKTGAKVYLVNTGWTGGAYGKGGERFAIPTTRTIISHIIQGQLDKAPMETMPGFGFEIPSELPGVAAELLNPRKSWANPQDYDIYTKNLIAKFKENFAKFAVNDSIIMAGPNSEST